MNQDATQLGIGATGNGRTALVTGAGGALGRPIVRRLRAAGYRVRSLDRKPPAPGQLPDEVECLQGDIADRAAVARAVQGVDVVFHLAAKLHINDPDPSLAEEYHRVNVEGTRRVVEAAVAANVPRLVFFSTICVYGPSVFPEVFDENASIRCDSWYGTTKYEAEKIVLSEAPAVVLRLAAAYGPGMKGNYLRLLRALQKYPFVYVGAGLNRRTLVFDEDVAAAALLVAEHPQALGQTYNVSDGQIHGFHDIVETMCQVLGRRSPRLHIPILPTRIVAGIVETGTRWLGQSPSVTRHSVDKLVEDIAVSDAKIERELGYRPQVDLARGWRQVAEAVLGRPARGAVANSRADQTSHDVNHTMGKQ